MRIGLHVPCGCCKERLSRAFHRLVVGEERRVAVGLKPQRQLDLGGAAARHGGHSAKDRGHALLRSLACSTESIRQSGLACRDAPG